jgi:hypothetical protein
LTCDRGWPHNRVNPLRSYLMRPSRFGCIVPLRNSRRQCYKVMVLDFPPCMVALLASGASASRVLLSHQPRPLAFTSSCTAQYYTLLRHTPTTHSYDTFLRHTRFCVYCAAHYTLLRRTRYKRSVALTIYCGFFDSSSQRLGDAVKPSHLLPWSLSGSCTKDCALRHNRWISSGMCIVSR